MFGHKPAIIVSLLVLIPIIFWTLTPNTFSTPKDFLIVLITASSLFTIAFTISRKKTLIFPTLGLGLPLLIFILSVIGSLLANPEGRPEALVSTALPLLSLPILALVLNTIKSNDTFSRFITSLSYVGGVLSIHSLVSLTFLSSLPQMPALMQNLQFTPTGSYLTTLALVVIGAFASVHTLHNKINKKSVITYLILALNLIATITLTSLLLTNNLPIQATLPLSASWSIALDALKSLRSLFFGIGLSNYDILYSSVKPLSLNSTDLWNILPSTGTNTILTLLPTAGVITTASFIFLILKLIISSHANKTLVVAIPIICTLLLMPPATPLYLIFFIFYALVPSQSNISLALNKNVAYLFSIIILIGTGWYGTQFARYLISERYVMIAQSSLASSDSQAVYQSQLKALNYSPNLSQYQLTFADLNYKLALALSKKNELSTSDKETIAQLIKQSIDSSKNAIALRPNNPQTWLTLGKIYQNLIGVAEGADNFALEAYTRAINLDRANPVLRLEYANLLSQIAATKKTPTESDAFNKRAETELKLAIQLKPDYSNSYYNLAHFFKKNGDNLNAKTMFEQTLKYHAEGTTEHSRILQDISSLTNSPSSTSSSSTSPSSALSTPSPLPEPIDDIPIDINSQ